MLDAPVIVTDFIDSWHSLTHYIATHCEGVSENPSSSLAIFPFYRTGEKLKGYIV